jgi:hypothetical protein
MKTIKVITLDVYNDPGHGWIKAPLSLLKQLNIVRLITTFSFIDRKDPKTDKGFAFLEEDQDAMTLINALQRDNIQYKFREHTANRDSKIRNYPRFTVYTAWGV